MSEPIPVGIFLFDDVEVLDFAGPAEVFSISAGEDGQCPFALRMFAEERRTVETRGGLRLMPEHDLESLPPVEVLVVPGGPGARRPGAVSQRFFEWLRERAQSTPIVASVCTGAFLLAAAGLLDGRGATTHWSSCNLLQQEHPAVRVRKDVRFVDEGAVVTSAGVAAGIDMTLHLVERLVGADIARATARRMEYARPRSAGAV